MAMLLPLFSWTQPICGLLDQPFFFVRKHTKRYLKSVELRPYSGTDSATKAERALAKKLRKQGYGVWSGHHDQKCPK